MSEATSPAPPDGLAAEPIERVLETLATGRLTPDTAVRACVARIEEAGPRLTTLLARAALHGLSRERDKVLLFRAIHILGAAGWQPACRPLLRLLRRPEDQIEDMIGDAVTEVLPRIMVGLFDGDATALFETISHRGVGEAARWSLLSAAAFLTATGRIDRDAMHEFMRRFDDETLARHLDSGWIGWGEAAAALGFRDLSDRVEEVWRAFPGNYADARHFREMLADAEMAPGDLSRFDALNVGPVGDAVALFDWIRPRPEGLTALQPKPAPALVNPLRGLGRNDPCPCGSGRKYKKCCMP